MAVVMNSSSEQYLATIQLTAQIILRLLCYLQWNGTTDGNGIQFSNGEIFDFKKYFNLKDHIILMQTLSLYDIPRALLIGFLIFTRAVSKESTFKQLQQCNSFTTESLRCIYNRRISMLLDLQCCRLVVTQKGNDDEGSIYIWTVRYF